MRVGLMNSLGNMALALHCDGCPEDMVQENAERHEQRSVWWVQGHEDFIVFASQLQAGLEEAGKAEFHNAYQFQ